MPRNRGAALGLAAAALAGATIVAYLRIISAQGEDDWDRVAAVAVIIAAAAVAAAGGALAGGHLRAVALTAAAALLVVLGVVGIFSIGLPLLVAGSLALAGALRSARAAGMPRHRVVGGFAGALPVAMAVLIGALSLTS